MGFQPFKDFENIFKLLGDHPIGGTNALENPNSSINLPDYDIESFLRPIIVDQRSKSLLFFMKTIDRISKNTDDYKRLKNFFVDWYASNKVILENRKNSIADVNAFRYEDIIEKLKSMGFGFLSIFATREDLINLYKDLVELYKIKGTPGALKQIFNFLHFDIKIYEFWLDYTGSDLILVGYNAFDSTDTISFNFNAIVNNDPQWLVTKDNIINLLENNKISLPVKTKYIGVNSAFSVSNLKAYFLILDLEIRLEIDHYNDNDPTSFENDRKYNFSSDVITYDSNVSVLELYLSYIYILEKYFNVHFNVQNPHRILSYYPKYQTDPNASPNDFYTIFIDFKNRLDKQNPTKSDINEFEDKYVWVNGQHIYEMLNEDSFDHCLENKFSDLKTALDNVLGNQDEKKLKENVFKLLRNINDLFDTFLTDINSDFFNYLPNLLNYISKDFDIFGDDFYNIINFFKPYHTQAILKSYISLNERLFDSHFFNKEDHDSSFVNKFSIKAYIVDLLHAGQERCRMEYPAGNVLWDIQGGEHYDCPGLYDKGAGWTSEDVTIIDYKSLYDERWPGLPDGIQPTIVNETYTSSDMDLQNYGEQLGISDADKITVRHVQRSGFPETLDVNSNLTFDFNTAAFDVVEIFLKEY